MKGRGTEMILSGYTWDVIAKRLVAMLSEP